MSSKKQPEAIFFSSQPGLLDQILRDSLCGIYVYNVAEGTNEYINSEYTRITGWTLEELNTLSGPEFATLFHDEDREAVFAHMAEVASAASDAWVEIEYRFRSKNGSWIWCLSRDVPLQRDEEGRLIRFLGTFLDITDRKNRHRAELLEEKQAQIAARGQSLSLLSGGLAHDFNNLLLTVMGSTELALLQLGTDSTERRLLERVMTASRRASELCRQLQIYSGHASPEKRPVALEAIVESVRATGRSDLDIELDRETPHILADQEQLRQLVLSLVENAAESLCSPERWIGIRSSTLNLPDALGDDHVLVEPTRPGLHLVIEVEDCGSGIDEATLHRLTEPFYSTRETGRGLGLATVQTIVQLHGGALSVRTRLGAGSCFRAFFPVSDEASEGPGSSESLRPTAGLPPPEPAAVLVIDDDAHVLETTRGLLTSVGCEVACAEGGAQGLKTLLERDTPFDVVLLDLTMPGMDGGETLREIRKTLPTIEVVLMSGYSELSVAELLGDHTRFLRKPFSLAQLRRMLAGILEPPRDRADPPSGTH